MPQAQSTRFLSFRYSLIARPNMPQDTRPLPDPKGNAILSALGIAGNRKFSYWKRPYVLVGFHDYADQLPEDGREGAVGRHYVGKVAKRTIIETGELVEGDILEGSAEHWVPVWVGVDTHEQVIIIEFNSKFGGIQQIQNVLTAGLRVPILEQYGYSIFVEPVSDPRRFWEIIVENPILYEIELNLVSPNILDTDRAARASVEALQQLFGQDEVTVTLESHTGGLKADRKSLENYLSYISNGEGWWRLVAKRIGQARKKTFSSRQQVREIPVELPDSAIASTQDEDVRRVSESRIVEAVASALPRKDKK